MCIQEGFHNSLHLLSCQKHRRSRGWFAKLQYRTGDGLQKLYIRTHYEMYINLYNVYQKRSIDRRWHRGSNTASLPARHRRYHCVIWFLLLLTMKSKSTLYKLACLTFIMTRDVNFMFSSCSSHYLNTIFSARQNRPKGGESQIIRTSA